MIGSAPFPPRYLRERVFAGGEPADSVATYDSVGRGLAGVIERCLPADWAWDGCRVLDFACGAGRVVRHLAAAHPTADWWGCDVHGPSVEWLQNASGTSIHALLCDPEPPLRLPSSYFDVVYGISAFTHLGWNWAAWLVEMHRIIRRGGLLIMTILGRAFQQRFLPSAPHEDLIGILVCGHGNPAADNGPVVFHSQWWLRAHWGRAFEIVEFRPDDVVVGRTQDGTSYRHSLLVATARDVPVSEFALMAPEPNEPREVFGLATALARTVQELEAARRD